MSKTKTAANAFIDLVTPNKPKTPPLSAAKEAETLNPFQVAQQNAQRNAALPVEQGGLGLRSDNTAEDRLAAQNYYDYLHGTQRLDRLLEGEGLDPKRATSGPMPYGTDKPELASRYATGKADTSRYDAGKMSDYFQVAPKDLGSRGKNLISVEQSWHYLSPEQKQQILSGYYRTGYANPEEGSGAFTLHPEGKHGSIASKAHLDHVLKEERGNPLAALRNLWGESGELYDNPEDLSQIFKMAGYPYDISQTNAPWTTAQGVMLGKARMDNPLRTSDTDNLINNVIPSLREQFKGDRTRLKVGADQWAKESRYTPNQWLEELEKDVLAGKNSFVWTSIPDKVTGALKQLGHDGIIDLGGKTGGEGHQVVIPFDPTQVRSKFAAFDPMEKSSADLLKAHGGIIRKADGGMVDSVPEEAIKNTVRDPQAARLLDLDLAKYALMNQPQRMAGGGQVLSEAIGGQVQTPIQGDMGKMSFEDYRKSIGMHEGGRHMAQGGQVQRFSEGGHSHDDINDLKPNRPSDVKSTNDKPQPKVPAIPVRDILATIGSDRAKHESRAADPTSPFQELSPHDMAAARLLDAANRSGNPERYLETLTPYHDSQLRFYAKDMDSPHPDWGGWVDPAEKSVANVNLNQSGDIIVPHELAHTRQFLSGQVNQQPLTYNPVYHNAQDLPESVRKNVLWGGNAGDNPMELWANIEAYAHKHNAAGGDFINSPEGRALFPTPELQREYYTRTIPNISSATPDTGTFVANPPTNRSKQSYAQKAMRALGYAEGGQVQRFDEGGQVSQDQMRYELANSPVMQATPRSPMQDFIGTAGGYMDRAGKFVSEAIEPTAEKHPVKHFLANMILADSLKSAGTALQDYTGTVRETDEDNPVRGIISKDWKNLTTSREPMLDPRALDLAGFASPVVKGVTKLGEAGAKAITPFAKSTAEMAAELYGRGQMPGMVAPNAYMAEPSAPKPAKALAPANEQGFYSPTEAAALNLQRKTGNGQAFLNDLMKGDNVSSEEISGMGLDTFLKDKKNVTAAEVQDYIAQNKLGLGESRYDDSITENAIGIPEHKGTKFKQYQLPGGENYREVVITTPIENNAALEAAQIKAGDARRQTGDLMVQWRELADVSKPGDPAVLDAYQKVAESRKLMNQAEAEADKLRTVASEKTYRSSHFDEPNILAHLRMSDRVTDGKKTLLVDEVQSDWHQAGREQGYQNDPKLKKLNDEIKEYESLVQSMINNPRQFSAENKARLDELRPIISGQGRPNKGVPDAPYKEDWYQLALRRAVKEAIDGGYDRVALPTGARVAERFDLSKQIDRIDYNKNEDGTYSMSAIKDGSEVFSKEGLDEKELSGLVGKDVAKKIVGDEGSSAPKADRWEAEDEDLPEFKSLSGLDLQVGGEGMKKYYDEIYPNYLKKFGKKYGSTVGKTTVDVEGAPEPLHYMDITPAMRKEFSTGIHMAKGGKVSFAKSADDMRKELLRNKHG